jgi:hypothetical protein
MNTLQEFKIYIQELSDLELLAVLETLQEFKAVLAEQQELLIREVEERGQFRNFKLSPLEVQRLENA